MFKIFKSFSKALGSTDKPAPKAEAAVKAASSKAAPAAKPAQAKSPEELCAVDPKMGKDEVRARLAVLYKRYNRATSSLDAKLRAEAEVMLDAIVAVREKHLGSI